jgi:antirestriction protein ArdC
MSGKPDVYSQVTNKIIADLERGNLTWLQPWQARHAAGEISRPLRVTGKPYRGINIMMLWVCAIEKGFSCPIWLTYKQAVELGGQVRKGEKGSLVVYADTFTKIETDDKGENVETEVPFMKGYTVFNAEQVDSLPAHFYARSNATPHEINRQEALERFFAATGVTIRHGGNQAYYSPAHDMVQMPPIEAFRDAESYYATLAHEVLHATKHA